MAVITNSPQADYTITGLATYHGSGWNFIQQNISLGTYTITWSPVAGCGTPPPETKTTDSRGSIIFAGNYKDFSTLAPSTTGTIDIRTNLYDFFDRDKITFILTGPQNKTIGGGNFKWYAPAGTYTITYSGEIDGYDAPAPQTKTLSAGGSITFEVNYTLSQTLPLTIDSFPNGATIYVDDVLVGKARLTKKVLRGATHRIRCTLSGYNDYVYNYVVAPLNSVSNSVKGDWMCLLTVKNGQTAPTVVPSSIPPQPQQILPSTRPPLLQEENTLPSVLPRTLPPQKPQGFFSRIWQAILSLFKK